MIKISAHVLSLTSNNCKATVCLEACGNGLAYFFRFRKAQNKPQAILHNMIISCSRYERHICMYLSNLARCSIHICGRFVVQVLATGYDVPSVRGFQLQVEPSRTSQSSPLWLGPSADFQAHLITNQSPFWEHKKQHHPDFVVLADSVVVPFVLQRLNFSIIS